MTGETNFDMVVQERSRSCNVQLQVEAVCSRARVGEKRPGIAEPQERRAMDMSKLGKGILLKSAKTSVVVEEKVAVESTRRCGPSWGLDICVSVCVSGWQGSFKGRNIPWTKLPSTRLPVCNRGWPTTILRNLSRPFLRSSITASSNLLK